MNALASIQADGLEDPEVLEVEGGCTLGVGGCRFPAVVTLWHDIITIYAGLQALGERFHLYRPRNFFQLTRGWFAFPAHTCRFLFLFLVRNLRWADDVVEAQEGHGLLLFSGHLWDKYHSFL